jgi:rhodanese-related sulfurtransferase
MIDKFAALISLRPGSSFEIPESGKVVWLDEASTCPTEDETAAEIARLQAEYDAKEYQRQRAAEYPSTADQFDLLYHGGYDAWKAAIDAVKTKYPKG